MGFNSGFLRVNMAITSKVVDERVNATQEYLCFAGRHPTWIKKEQIFVNKNWFLRRIIHLLIVKTNTLHYQRNDNTIVYFCIILTQTCTIEITTNVCLLWTIYCCTVYWNLVVISLIMATTPKHVRAKQWEEYIYYRIMHFLVLPGF